MNPEVVIADPQTLVRLFAERVAALAGAAIAERGRFSCALTGGSAAEQFLPALARAPLAWEQCDVFWGDERAVPPGDPQSNYGLAKRLLLDPAAVPERRVHRMMGEGADLPAAARAYEARMFEVLGTPPRLDLIVLGSHGRGATKRFLLGSVAERVVRHAPCSVLIAR